MFNKLKQFKDLRAQAKHIQNTLAQEIVDHETRGLKMKMDGNMQLKELLISEDWLTQEKKGRLEEGLKEVHNDLVKKVQRKAAEAMRKSGDLERMNLPF